LQFKLAPPPAVPCSFSPTKTNGGQAYEKYFSKIRLTFLQNRKSISYMYERGKIFTSKKGGEDLKPCNSKKRVFDDFHKFDSFCKKVLANEVRDYFNELKRKQKREAIFSELSAQERKRLQTTDSYFVTEQIFNVLGQDIIVNDGRVANALLNLAKRKRDIILLAYFLDMTDREIGEKLNLIRATVQYQRKITLKELRKVLEEGNDDD
jgi:DNA-directed RNA polymerase specialized sigma24 family protein